MLLKTAPQSNQITLFKQDTSKQALSQSKYTCVTKGYFTSMLYNAN